MPDLSRIQNAQPIQVTDDSAQVAVLSTGPSGTEVGLIVRNIPYGTQTVVGTVTASPTGTYTVVGTTTMVPTGTQVVSGTITASPTGTYTVAGTITATPTGTYTVDINGPPVTTTTISTVTVSSSSSTTLLASNVSRNMATFFNEGSNLIWLVWGSTASATNYSVQIPPNAYYEMPVPVYAGVISALAQTASVVIRITEM